MEDCVRFGPALIMLDLGSCQNIATRGSLILSPLGFPRLQSAGPHPCGRATREAYVLWLDAKAGARPSPSIVAYMYSM